MNIILSTRNPSKAEQIRAIFADTPITILTLTDAEIEGEVIEDGSTLEENAMKKALFAHRPKEWAMADDTGFFIDALNGKPGVHAADWAGDVSTDEITKYTLEQLKGVRDRRATFETVVALLTPSGELRYFRGRVEGNILDTPRVPNQPKMPYSSIFVPKGSNKVWAEMTTHEENKISHRGEAFRKVREFLWKL